jgi:hypothetical protein
VNPSRMALFDLSSSWLEGSHCPLGARGYSRDGKKGNVQIEYGLLTDPEGRPVAVRVFEGNTADPAAFTEIAGVVKDTFGLKRMVMVGDRGMMTSARVEALKELDDKYVWITVLRAPAIRKLMADDGPLQLSLFDEQDLAEISSDDFPGERLIACRNPALADERARKREDLLAATEKLLAPLIALIARVAAGRLAGAGEIGKKVGEVLGKYKMAKHFTVTITDASLAAGRKQDQIDAEARLHGIYAQASPSHPRGPLGIRRRQGLTPARRQRPPLPQLPRPARPPRHARLQRAALHRNPRRRPRPHPAHQSPATGLRSRHPDRPAEVARNRRQAPRESAGQRRSRHPQAP